MTATRPLLKRCSRCKEIKSSDLFCAGRSEYCKQCRASYRKEYDADRRASEPTFGERIRAQQVKCRMKKDRRITHMFTACKFNAQRRKIPFNITRSDVVELFDRQKWICARSGIPFDLVHGEGKKPFSPSIDRIDNDKGYDPENVQIVCTIYNYAKNVFTDQDVLCLAYGLLRRAFQPAAGC